MIIIFVEDIKFSRNIIDNITIVNCKVNLIFGESIIFLSEAKPTRYIKSKKILNKKFMLRKNEPSKNTKPPKK